MSNKQKKRKKGNRYMIDLSSVLMDSELGGTSFFVSRKNYIREMGEVVPSSVEGLEAQGNIQPASSEDLRLFLQEERSEEMIIILSPFHFRLGEDDGTSFTSADMVTWNGKKYRVVKVKNWASQGGFYKAWAIRQK